MSIQRVGHSLNAFDVKWMVDNYNMIKFLSKSINSPLAKSTLLYTGGDAIGKAIPFFLLPIVTKYLTTTDFGILSNFSVAVQIFTAICALNTYSALTVSYFSLKEEERASYISNLIYLICLLAFACLLVVVIFSDLIAQRLGISLLWQILAIVSSLATSIFMLHTSVLRMEKRPIMFSSIQIFQALIAGLLAIYFVVILKWNWQGRVLSMVGGSILSVIVSLWLLMKERHIFTKIDVKNIKEAFSFGLPLLPHTLSFWFKSGVDKIILTNIVSLSANGVYSIALTLVSVIGIFTGSFFNAYSPLMYKDLSLIDQVSHTESIELKLKLVKISYLFSCLLITVCFGCYFMMSWIIPIFFRGDYLGALRVLPFLMLTLFFEGMYSIVSGYIFYRKKTKVLGSITFGSSLLQMALTIVLVKRFGIMGAAYSSVLVSITTFLLVFGYANTLYELPWLLRRR
ncbi:polysaccharide biosynthesis protein [Geothrix oryzae]|uniref:Polysaccharide biosynthesis protein n=1 Tax=Geothrix oryzae TaxID=2927975 RepID=A0ABM8DTR5_9BACT|nr:oligosaccharide flippase family protein [Geothrix oryzae]BDU70469.1 polysaccharide biosynthesis protein [Geothrix oryzae]